MGQASSSQRDQRQENVARSITPSRLQSNGHGGSLNPHDMSEQPINTHLPREEGGGDSQSNGVFNFEADPSSSYLPSMLASGNTQPTNTIDYTQDIRPLSESLQGSRGSSASRIMSRRQSTMSRLGSRILPNSVIRGLLNSEEETPAEGHAHRNGRVSRSIPRAEPTHSGRFSPFHSLGSRGITRRRSIRGPYPVPRSDGVSDDSLQSSRYLNPNLETISGSVRGWRRSPRLNRVRNSLSTPISHLFGPPSLSSSDEPRIPPQLSSRSSMSDDVDRLLPPLAPMDTTMGFDEATEMDSVEPSSMDGLASTSPRSRMNQGPGPVRRLPGILRSRSSRLPRREDQTSLSRVLQLAAAAIAAQLSGSAVPTLPNIQSLGNDGLDASLENLIQSLQQATSTQGGPSGNLGTPSPPSDGSTAPAPVNFLRVFRFANSENQGGRSNAENRDNNGSGAADPMDIDEPSEETTEGRTVTLVVVGVRSVPTNGPLGGQQNNGGMGLDALLGLPLMPSTAVPRDRPSTGNIFRNADGSSRLPPPRPVDGAANSILGNLDNQPRRSLSNESQRRPPDSTSTDAPSSTLPTTLSDSPPGPNPPPSTPAEPALSAVSSGNSTPSRRPSSASAMFPNPLPQVHEESPRQPTVESEASNTTAPTSGTRQRRRSDSEFARHRHLGLGAARRNGVVEPDQPTASTGRTWVIYVVGTNLSENHPAFATPSLFTDVSSSIISKKNKTDIVTEPDI